MVTLEMIRKDMEILLQADQSVRYVDVSADSIDEALSDAAVQLDSKTSSLEYEVIEKGFTGFMGFVKKPWTIRVYENASIVAKKKKRKETDIFSDEEFQEEEVNVDRDGLFYIRYFASQIHLKVVPPAGSGQPVSFKEVQARLKRSDTIAIEEDLVKKFVENGTGGVYEPIGQYKHNPAGDALIVVDTSNDEMKATITVTSPTIGGAEVSAEIGRAHV